MFSLNTSPCFVYWIFLNKELSSNSHEELVVFCVGTVVGYHILSVDLKI